VLRFDPTGAGARGDLVAVTPETGAERALVRDVAEVRKAIWSADGRWVAYETDGPRGVELWVVGASQRPRRVATGASLLGWSSSGAELATIRLKSPLYANLAGSPLRTIDPMTGETTDIGAIPHGTGDVTSAPAWSPDLTRFVFGARGGAISSIDVRSGARSLLARLPGEHLDSVDRIAWAPNGAHIAVYNDLKPGSGRLFVLNPDGSDIRVLRGAENVLAWSPDGTRLAYQDGSGVVRVASMDGSDPAEIGPLAASCSALFCLDDLTWSPDGSRIALRSVGGDGMANVSAIDADGSGSEVPLDELTYESWRGGSYDHELFG
jgi:Tol biopolymer transport system component